MTEDFKESLVKYQNLKRLSSFEGLYFSKKYIKKARRNMISQLDEVLDFKELYSILKPIENEKFGFSIIPYRREQIVDSKRIIYQQVEVSAKANGNIDWINLNDNGYGFKHTEENVPYFEGYSRSVEIDPNEIISISNISILESIKELDKKIYKYALKKIIEFFYSEVEEKYEEKLLLKMLSNVIKNFAQYFIEYADDTIYIEKENDTWIVYEAKEGRKSPKIVCGLLCEACICMLKKIEENKNIEGLEEEFLLEFIE